MDQFPAIEATYHFSKYASQLPEVDATNFSLVQLIERVRSDIDETERLLGIPSVNLVLEHSPLKRTWVKNGIHNIKSALNDIGLFIERIRLGKNGGADINFAAKVRLVFQSSGRLENQRSELATCHQTLIAILNVLSPLEFQTDIYTIDPPKMPLSSCETIVSDQISQGQCRSNSTLNEMTNPTKYDSELCP